MSNQEIKDIEESRSSFESVDFDKLKSIIIRSLPVVILLIIISLSTSTIAIRYTKQLFQSSSTLQFDIKSEAKVFGFKSFDDDINNLAREIEIIKSRLFLNKVAEALDYKVSYYQYGDILFEERYGNSPFKVHLINCSSSICNRKIDLEILDNNTYKLKYEIGGNIISNTYSFNDTISTKDFKILVELIQGYNSKIDNRYFFTLNTQGSILNYINQNLAVKPLDFKAKTITISFKDHNRQKARDIVHAIDTLYIYYTQLEKNKANKQKIGFLNEQLGQTEEKLTELENYFENFTIDNKTMDLGANLSKTIVLLEQLDSQQFSIQQKIKSYNEIFDDIIEEDEFDINPVDVSVFPNDMRQELERLNTLYQEKEILLSSYNENTFAYQKKNQEINFLKDRLVKYIESTRNKLYENLDALKSSRIRLEAEFVALPSKRTEYSKTERYYGLYEEFYLSLMKNKAEFELAQAGTVTDYRILSSASTPSSPLSPNKTIYYGIGIVVGLLLSFIFIGVRYLLHNKITSQQELERSSSAFVLGTIPYYSKEKKIDTRLVVDNNLKSEISEAFRSIRTNLEFLNGHDRTPVIAITSTISGEGKTFIAANLGGIISLLINRVVLIDLDMRKPRFHEVFEGTDPSKGLSTILIKKHEVEECIHKTNLENLDYIPAGPIPPNPSELILGGQFEKLMKYLETKYDVIIIDTPPVGLVTDGIHALKIATIPIYIVRADFSKKAFLKNINRLIKVHKLNNLSLILNSLKKPSNGTYSYGYGYGHGHGYYEDKQPGKTNKLKRLFQS
ncbi:MAG: polysaccharide biosynthesis tyrosine autokinase [Cyclobacteriaceae bacterium]|nr:polysaccharide biosynthesis tyrosine autokinase [Cyclobacteriaceae bacterium]